MIFETLRQIKSDPDIREYLSEIKYLVVDEYQDVNDLQEKLIFLPASNRAEPKKNRRNPGILLR